MRSLLVEGKQRLRDFPFLQALRHVDTQAPASEIPTAQEARIAEAVLTGVAALPGTRNPGGRRQIVLLSRGANKTS